MVHIFEKPSEFISCYDAVWVVVHKLFTSLIVGALYRLEHRFVKWLGVVCGVWRQTVYVNGVFTCTLQSCDADVGYVPIKNYKNWACRWDGWQEEFLEPSLKQLCVNEA